MLSGAQVRRERVARRVQREIARQNPVGIRSSDEPAAGLQVAGDQGARTAAKKRFPRDPSQENIIAWFSYLNSAQDQLKLGVLFQGWK